MADVYVRHGETNNGDGTTSAIAASPGGVGAYNDLKKTLEDDASYTVNAGDTVYVKTTDETDSDFTIAMTAGDVYGASAASEASPVTWIFDDGTVWSGKDGTVSINKKQHGLTLQQYNRFLAVNYNLVILSDVASSSSNVIPEEGATFHQVLFDWSLCTTLSPKLSLTGPSYFYDCKIRTGKVWTSGGAIYMPNAYVISYFYNLQVDVTHSGGMVIYGVGYGNTAYFIGGRVYGVGATSSTKIIDPTQTSGFVAFQGFVYPRDMEVDLASSSDSARQFFGNSVDGILGSFMAVPVFQADSRDDGFYPTLNAVLPTSTADGWSYKIYPFNASEFRPAQLTLSQLYTLTAATKTITVNFLSNDDMATPTSDKYWVELTYIDDTTGEPKHLSSFDLAATTISTSTAGWSATTYGPSSFTKREIALTTGTTIKQDTAIMITFFCGDEAVNPTDLMFLCPSPVLS